MIKRKRKKNEIRPNSITVQDLKSKLENKEDFLLIDVRGIDEFEDWHIKQAKNIPLPSLGKEIEKLKKQKKQVITLCAHDPRSQTAFALLSLVGINTKYVTGGMVEWNSVYDTAKISTKGFLDVLQVRRIGKGCLAYFLSSKNEAIVIDPSIDIDFFINLAKENNLKIVSVLDTHTHADHVSGGRKLADKLKCGYFNPDNNISIKHKEIDEKTKIKFGTKTLKVILTPGHTKESVTYLIDDLAFTGDTLFVESVGRPDLLQEAKENAQVLYNSIHEKILTLGEQTIILPAHYSENVKFEFSIPIQKKIYELMSELDALSLIKNEFSNWASENLQEKPSNFEKIKQINQGKLSEDKIEEIRELEAGANKCAVK